MSPEEKEETVLSDAKKFEKKYRWAEARTLYEQALGLVGKGDPLRKGEIQEKIGYCFQRAAFQAESRDEFKQRMQRANEAFQETKGFYEKLADTRKDARIFRCDAIAARAR